MRRRSLLVKGESSVFWRNPNEEKIGDKILRKCFYKKEKPKNLSRHVIKENH
jgi:hypothetical protein